LICHLNVLSLGRNIIKMGEISNDFEFDYLIVLDTRTLLPRKLLVPHDVFIKFKDKTPLELYNMTLSIKNNKL